MSESKTRDTHKQLAAMSFNPSANRQIILLDQVIQKVELFSSFTLWNTTAMK